VAKVQADAQGTWGASQSASCSAPCQHTPGRVLHCFCTSACLCSLHHLHMCAVAMWQPLLGRSSLSAVG
jgi:hypothetical protein